MQFSLGIGLTNACNLACDHCYRATGTDSLTMTQVLDAVAAVPTRSVNFGTGENGLHAEFPEVVRRLSDQGIAVTMTTNGYSAEVLDDATLSRFKDVEFSIDHPDKAAHNHARGDGNWELIEAQMQRCQRLGVATTITSVLMSTNVVAMPALLQLAGSRGALLRVNVYQAVKRDMFSLSFQQFWEAFTLLLEHGDLVACGEPIVRAMLGIERAAGAGCGVETIRITPRGALVPCVYGGDDALSLDDLGRLGEAVVAEPLFTRLRVLPEACKTCPQRETCGGGCASRRALRHGLERAEEYCPILRGVDMPLQARMMDLGRSLPKASSACTTIFRARAL
jgi:radical SAM protein with 4Fe4S-binding SPASM domain